MKRACGVFAVQLDRSVFRCHERCVEGRIHHSARPRTPDPYDRSFSKRRWENLLFAYKKVSQQLYYMSERKADGVVGELGLVSALHNIGYTVIPFKDGPLWALRDGNIMLDYFQRRLSPVSASTARANPGQYILWYNGMFAAAICWKDFFLS